MPLGTVRRAPAPRRSAGIDHAPFEDVPGGVARAEVIGDLTYRESAGTVAADVRALPDVATLAPQLTDHSHTAT
ncbi:MAG TPA: hypothetical protein VFY88_12870 [Intrasporangium sp.]|nr:hypothetical protein [Intrasporangium sp.]